MKTLLLTLLLLTSTAHAMAKIAPHEPSPTPPTPGQTALHCGILYIAFGPTLDRSEAELRDNCYYSNYCYTHGKTGYDIKVESDGLHIRFGGRARLRMDYCGNLFCQRENVGHERFSGELVVDPANLDSAVIRDYHTVPHTIFADDKPATVASESVQCTWEAPHAVLR
jgi:hypothetical protein